MTAKPAAKPLTAHGIAGLKTGEWARYQTATTHAHVNVECEDDEGGCFRAFYIAEAGRLAGYPGGQSMSANCGAALIVPVIEAWAAGLQYAETR